MFRTGIVSILKRMEIFSTVRMGQCDWREALEVEHNSNTNKL